MERLWIMNSMMKILLFREEVKEVVGRVEEGCFTLDLSPCGQELNAVLKRPHAHSTRQSPIKIWMLCISFINLFIMLCIESQVHC